LSTACIVICANGFVFWFLSVYGLETRFGTITWAFLYNSDHEGGIK
jgi:hypothetical protein